jgi:hypothetical protein
MVTNARIKLEHYEPLVKRRCSGRRVDTRGTPITPGWILITVGKRHATFRK